MLILSVSRLTQPNFTYYSATSRVPRKREIVFEGLRTIVAGTPGSQNEEPDSRGSSSRYFRQLININDRDKVREGRVFASRGVQDKPSRGEGCKRVVVATARFPIDSGEDACFGADLNCWDVALGSRKLYFKGCQARIVEVVITILDDGTDVRWEPTMAGSCSLGRIPEVADA